MCSILSGIERKQMEKNKKIKLLLSEPSSDVAGGVSQYILSIIRYLSREEFDIHLAIPGDGPLFGVMAGQNIEAHSLPVDYSIWSFLPSVFKLRKFLAKEKFDIIHLHTAKSGFIGSVASVGLPHKIIYTGHCWRFKQKESFLSRLLYYYFDRFICWSADFVTVLSDYEYGYGIDKKLINASNARVVSMSIDAKRFDAIDKQASESKRKEFKIPEDAFIVGTVGRIALQKDPETFVRVAADLKSKISNVYFLWVGDGDLRDMMIKLAKDLGVDDRIVITGRQESNSIPDILSIIDVFLFTSRFEGLPISILEAMAARRLIVSTDVDSIPDVVLDKKTGWTFSPGDHERASLIIREIRDNVSKYDGISEAALDLINKRYSPASKMSEEFADVYRRVLSS